MMPAVERSIRGFAPEPPTKGSALGTRQEPSGPSRVQRRRLWWEPEGNPRMIPTFDTHSSAKMPLTTDDL